MRHPAWRRGQGLAAALVATACLSPGHSLAQDRQWHALPVAGGTDVLSAAAGLEPGLPEWRVFYECAERRYGLWGEAAGAAAPSAAAKEGGARVPLPLAPTDWLRILGRGGVPDEQLAPIILADRRLSLLYRGLAALDEPTLAAFAAKPEVLRRIYRQHADVLAAFGGRFQVRDGAVVVPGGAQAAPLWDDLVGESPAAPALFFRKLLAANGGRRAFFFDSVARLDPKRQRFALGTDEPAGPKTKAAFLAMAAVFDREAAWWSGAGGAFARPDVDAVRLLREVRLRADGSLAPPAAVALWEVVFAGTGPASGAISAREIRPSPAARAAWLAERIATGAAAVRRLRFEQLAFAQRVFGEAGEGALPEVFLAVQALRDARAAVLALERMGTRDPALYAAAAAAARRAGANRGHEAKHRALDGLQGALGVIDRARFARTLDVAASERLARSLFALPFDDEAARDRALASWVEATLVPELARAVSGARGEPETTVLRAMAGGPFEGREGLVPFDWEGLSYEADPGRTELARLERVRVRQGGAGLADALRACRSPAEKRPDPCAEAIGPALVALVYAAHLGDPDGPALAGEDPSRRHDFGEEPWALPEEVSGPGIPWHVRGSLLGLERALARLALHRLEGDALPEGPPVLDAALRRSLAVPVGIVNPRDLDDAARDAIAAAIASGRRRVASLRTGDTGVEAAGRDAGLEPWRLRAFEWVLAHEPAARDSFFSLGELLHLGAPGGGPWDAWGVADDLAGGLCPRLPGPRPLDEAWGRRPETAVEESFVDVGLRVAVHLSERRLPARLGAAMVATLLPDLFAEARPVAADDRLGLDAWVRAQPLERLDDAVASVAGRGALQPPPRPGEAR